MFDEMAFKKAYKEAYDRIRPDQACIRRLRVQGSRDGWRYGCRTAIKRAAAACAVLCLLTVMTLPVMAEKIPAVYEIVERYAPVLADYVMPEKLSSTSSGITMQVEAIKVEGNTAEILVSFSDADDSTDLIRGKADLYDSYALRSYDAESNIGGCSFLEYDGTEDKAYFKIDVMTYGKFDRSKLSFSVHQLLTDCRQEMRQVALENMVKNPVMKSVTLSGGGGSRDSTVFEQYFGAAGDDFPQKSVQVMDFGKTDDSMAEALTVTGIGYADGMLRVQLCRGNFTDADRHAHFFIKEAGQEERHPDLGVSWQEKAGDETLLFEEDWFLVDEKELEKLELYGDFRITDGSVKGNWKVTFRIS